MRKSIFQMLIDGESAYIPVKWDGSDVIRVSGHMPNPKRLLKGRITAKCKNVYLIFVKNMIDKKSGLAKLIHVMGLNNPEIKMCGETDLNNLIVEIGKDAKKGMNYQIIEANSDDEIDTAVKKAKERLKTTVFVPLKYIPVVG